MTENTAPETQLNREALEEKLHALQHEERKIKEQIASLQAEMSRTQGQGRRRAEISRSSALPALQMQQRRLRAEIFGLEQSLRTTREQDQ